MKFEHFRYYKTLIEEGSFTNAAKKLFISSSALSHFISGLEAELGVVLLTRSKNRGFQQTAFGEAFYKTSCDILKTWIDFETQIKDATYDLHTSLTIGISSSKCPVVLTKAIKHLKEKYPNIKINIASSFIDELENNVSSGKYDIAFAAYLEERRHLQYCPVFIDKVHLVCPIEHPFVQTQAVHASSDRLPVSLQDVSRYPFVLVNPKHLIGRLCKEYCDTNHITLNVETYTDYSLTSFDLIESNNFCTLIPCNSIPFDKTQFFSAPLEPPLFYNLGFYYRKNNPSELLRHLVRMIKREIASAESYYR